VATENSQTRKFLGKKESESSVNQSLLGKSNAGFENLKLEEKIKELQQNLSSLP
jgi:hypothetical protein